MAKAPTSSAAHFASSVYGIHRKLEDQQYKIQEIMGESSLKAVMTLAIGIIAIVGWQCPNAMSVYVIGGTTVGLSAVTALFALKSIDDSRKLTDRKECCRETASAVFLFVMLVGLIGANSFAMASTTLGPETLCIMNSAAALLLFALHTKDACCASCRIAPRSIESPPETIK